MTETPTSRQEEPAPPRSSKHKSLGAAIDSRVSALQSQYLDNQSSAVSALAKLRRGIGKEVGDLPEIWEYTYIESEYAPRGRHTEAENAAYTAMTLYSLHQQSKRTKSVGKGPGDRMHWLNVSLGRACRMYQDKAENEDSRSMRGNQIRQRLNAVATASTFSGVSYYLRELINLLRRDSISLDYGMLADDLCAIQTPAMANAVRRQWMRDYYKTPQRIVGNTDSTQDSEENS